MKLSKLFAVLCAAALTGCSSVSESVNNIIENDANIGKNAPAVGITLTEITEAEVTETETSVSQKSKSEKYAERADELLSEMSADEKIGQLLLARMPANAAQVISEYNFGGYTMYADDFKNASPESVTALTAEISSSVTIAPFIAVDEEGGTVVRVSKYTAFRDEPFSSPQVLYGRGGAELLEIDAKEKAELLTSLGINLNLAPVADISEDENSYIYPRTMGQDPEHTAEAVAAIVSASADRKLASCLKHFPGYGENTDTHKGMAHDSRELYEFYNRDFVPFSAGINAVQDKTPAVMVGHTIYDNIDPDYPASLSSAIHEVLRDKLEFDGVAITDDMGMDAIKEYAGDGSVYVKAILADNDMICVTDYETAYNDLKAAYESGELGDDIIDSHVRRILMMKLGYGIIK